MDTGSADIFLERSRPPKVLLNFSRLDHIAESDRLTLTLKLKPFSLFHEPAQAEDLTQQLLSVVRAFAQRFPLSQGMAHSFIDYFIVTDEHRKRHGDFLPLNEEAYWLNIYGAPWVERFGRQHLQTIPASYIEVLPDGAILCLTRPTPADFDSEEARLAQARALAHVHPERTLETTLPALRERSRVFEPMTLHFDEDVADILRLKMDAGGLLRQREFVQRFNTYHPPPVTEWLPASQAPASNVTDVAYEIETYEHHFTQQLLAQFHKDVPALRTGSPDSLPSLDFHLWHSGEARLPATHKELLVGPLGGWLGTCLVRALGGRWIPRRELTETTVVVGDRAWLPFLRARHALQESQSPLDASHTQLFRVAQRLHRTHTP